MTVEKRLAFNSFLLLATVALIAYMAWQTSGVIEYMNERIGALEAAEEARKRRRKVSTNA